MNCDKPISAELNYRLESRVKLPGPTEFDVRSVYCTPLCRLGSRNENKRRKKRSGPGNGHFHRLPSDCWFRPRLLDSTLEIHTRDWRHRIRCGDEFFVGWWSRKNSHAENVRFSRIWGGLSFPSISMTSIEFWAMNIRVVNAWLSFGGYHEIFIDQRKIVDFCNTVVRNCVTQSAEKSISPDRKTKFSSCRLFWNHG